MPKKLRKREVRIHRQLVPAELRLEQILDANPPDFKPKHDLFLHLMHLTVEIPAKRKELLREDGYVPFSSRILQDLDRDSRKHLDYLVKHEILEESRHFLPGSYCMGYKLNDSLLSEGMKWAELRDEKFMDKLSAHYEVKQRVEEKYRHLANCYFSEEFTIDEESAERYSHELYLEERSKGVKNALRRHIMRLYKIDCFKAGPRWFKADGVDHRLHTNLTNMDKELRKFITYRGQSIVAVDVKNSQPFLSIEVLRQNLLNLDDHYLRNTNTYSRDPSTGLYTPMLVKSTETSVSIDVYRYIQLVVYGDLYPYLIQEFERKYGEDYFGDNLSYDEKKGIMKTQVFGIMYASSDAPMKGKALFRKLFPGVVRAFTWHKAGDPNRLPIDLQQLEAKLILDKACKRLAKEHPTIPIWSVHDCLATTEGNEEVVASVMREVFKDEIGFEPSLGFEIWCKDCPYLTKAA